MELGGCGGNGSEVETVKSGQDMGLDYIRMEVGNGAADGWTAGRRRNSRSHVVVLRVSWKWLAFRCTSLRFIKKIRDVSFSSRCFLIA